MVFTRHRFISSLGDDAEKYYQQKYLLSVPITEDHDVVLNPPKSWMPTLMPYLAIRNLKVSH